MTRRPTPSEVVWPDVEVDVAVEWAASITTQVLDWTWRAYDSLCVTFLPHVDLTQPLEQIERDLARNHFVAIQVLFQSETEGFATFVPTREWHELETRSRGNALPSSNDFAFVSTTCTRWAWPMEAKVIPASGSVTEYLKDVEGKFAKGVAAPLVGEGAMIGYLLTNELSRVVANLSERLNQTLEPVAEFASRPHHTTTHSRDLAPDLRLHHLLMNCVRDCNAE